MTGDATDEQNETVAVTLSSPVNATLAAGAATGTGTVVDDDGAPTLTLDAPSVAEGTGATGGTLRFTVTLSPASTQQVTVNYRDAGTGTAISGTDYTALTAGTLTFTAGTTTQTIDVSVTGDAADEPHETVAIALSAPVNAALGLAARTGTITDDDDAPTVSINSPSVAEGTGATGGTLTFTVSLSAASGRPVRVAYARTGGTATAGAAGAPGTDYTALTAGTLTFAAGTTTQTIDVSVTGDAADEPDETVVVTLSAPVNATLATGAGTGTITDDDAAPTVSINSPSVAEGAPGTAATLRFTVSLSAASGRQVTVDYADAGTGTATSGEDYAALVAGTLTFGPGTTTRTIDVSVTGDAADEAHETVVVTLSAPVNAILSAAATGTGTVNDDDARTLSIDSPIVMEGTGATGGVLTFTVSLSTASGRQVTVAYADAGTGTATSGTDYTALPAGTLTFAAGTTTRTIDVSVTGDATDEPNETVAVTLSSPVNAVLAVGAATGTGTITDDDGAPPPPPSLSIDAPRVAEGAPGATAALRFTVSLSAASVQQVTVDYADAGTGTATSGEDYTAIPAGTLTFAPGTTARTIDVSVIGDAEAEPDETVVVTLSAPVQATLAPGAGTGTGTITDDDDAPTVSVDSPSVAEGASGVTATLRFTVTLSAASTRQVTVAYADAGTGTATSGEDYTALPAGTLTFAPGTTARTIDVTVTGDAEEEPDETVVVTLSAPVNATLAADAATGTGTIADDDAADLRVETTGGPGTTTRTVNGHTVTVVVVDGVPAGGGGRAALRARPGPGAALRPARGRRAAGERALRARGERRAAHGGGRDRAAGPLRGAGALPAGGRILARGGRGAGAAAAALRRGRLGAGGALARRGGRRSGVRLRGGDALPVRGGLRGPEALLRRWGGRAAALRAGPGDYAAHPARGHRRRRAARLCADRAVRDLARGA